MIAAAVYTSTAFFSFNHAAHVLIGRRAHVDPTASRSPPYDDASLPAGDRLTNGELAVAGFVAGAFTTLFTCPFEVAKITQQINTSSKPQSMGRTFLGLVRDSYARESKLVDPLRALYSGFGAHFLRDSVGSATYFLFYFGLKRELESIEWFKSNQTAKEIFAGGLGGSLCWASILPLDTIKSRGQALKRPVSFFPLVKRMLEEEGPKSFFRGGVPMVVRAFPVNAVTFLVYEECNRYVSGRSE